MKKLFNRAGVFTDIHFGKMSDSEIHNKDNLEYIDWFIGVVKEQECDAILFLGDWFDNQTRHTHGTVWFSNIAIEKLIATNLPIYWIIGNHDMFYKHHRGVHSLPYLKYYPNITLINDVKIVDNVAFCPYPVGEEKSSIGHIEAKYIFGHFELPLFLVNQMYAMEDHGGLHMEHFHSCEAVFSGHFHKRQIKTNSFGIPITYIGNTFGHDFNDDNDRQRGCMVLPWDAEPIFFDYKDGPNYTYVLLSELFETIENGTYETKFNKKSIIDVTDNVGITTDEGFELKEMLSGKYRDLRISYKEDEVTIETETDTIEKNNPDQMVIDHLTEIDTHGSKYDPKILIQIFESSNNR